MRRKRQRSNAPGRTGTAFRPNDVHLPRHNLAGTITVCGQCLRPGHRANECRRAVTCRRCRGVGHKGTACHAEPRHAVKAQPAPPPPNVAAPSPPQPTPHEVPPPKDQPPKQKTKKHKATQGKPINSKAPPWRTQLEADGMEHLFISVGLNKGILNGRERMKTFSIITVKERKAGSVTIQDITDVLACLVDEHWTWTVKPLRDGRYIVAFPTAELARQTEKAGPLSVLAFDLSFEPWSPDLTTMRESGGRYALGYHQKPPHGLLGTRRGGESSKSHLETL
ncbi:hypothetical protein J5N97_003941 [Dioscorea zingiberensis]|uniref:CCHC-type domain-containing protein n=1 Tax=Dioscorea zingiberensis TaxID=325984 RepID=A0A9D5D7M9_9LILI|nr:hypothetical protein J5N97_003941 [Dioscorea zingiberensis]